LLAFLFKPSTTSRKPFSFAIARLFSSQKHPTQRCPCVLFLTATSRFHTLTSDLKSKLRSFVQHSACSTAAWRHPSRSHSQLYTNASTPCARPTQKQPPLFFKLSKLADKFAHFYTAFTRPVHSMGTPYAHPSGCTCAFPAHALMPAHHSQSTLALFTLFSQILRHSGRAHAERVRLLITHCCPTHPSGPCTGVLLQPHANINH